MGYDVTRRTVPNINPLKEDPAGDYKITLPKNRQEPKCLDLNNLEFTWKPQVLDATFVFINSKI